MIEAVIVEAVRTPIGRRGGKLSGLHPTELLAATLSELVSRSGIDPGTVDDVICGCVSQVNEQSMNIARNAWLAAGLPEGVPATTIDRQCGSSQQAAHFAAQGVMAGAYEAVIACGVESMSRVPMGSSMSSGVPFTPQLFSRYDGKLVMQGVSAELLAADFDLSREALDDYGFRSHARAAAAAAEAFRATAA
ncbi:MAG: hypothetical protein NVSMB32_11990 [Actinomycetota bacterium]